MKLKVFLIANFIAGIAIGAMIELKVIKKKGGEK